MHTIKEYEFSTEREDTAVEFARLERESARPHEEVYVSGPTLLTAEKVWPVDVYPQMYRDAYTPRLVVRVERFS